ncbi:dipeptidase [Laceyella sacchari]|uniref:Dipeptidase n=1 Tax=Laceyella sacchari TaxID=37482 RepID=A0ABY5U1C2_LACSH|nr:dipeptidase [Laceyella sacchari]UWE02420.1 dipeptidase [Laceyella sacchari]
MRWIDGHCDVLSKMWRDPQYRTFYDQGSPLDSSYHCLREAGVAMQVFAVWTPESVPRQQRLAVALKEIDFFYEEVVRDGSRVFLVTDGGQMDECGHGRIGALLLLEGADALHGDLANLRLFHRLGVRQMGLTWNFANEVADGIYEERGGGLTRFGRQVIIEMKRLGMILDVSHLSDRGFWEVIEETGLPILASHSNCRTVCAHKRNLGDEQIEALIQRQGLIGVTFVPEFVHDCAAEATIDQVLRHVEHICTLGGADHLFFGSDFDGFANKLPGLESYNRLPQLVEALSKRYGDDLVRKWGWENGKQFYQRHLSP